VSDATGVSAAPPERRVLHTADGLALDAELRWVDDPTALVVLAHPHPAYGGSMHALVTDELFRTLPAAGMACLRFDFRGVGGSGGAHTDGADEPLDVQAAVDALAAVAAEHEVPAPLVLSGWSFGADMALAVGDPRVAGWVGVAAPLRFAPPERMVAAHDDRPVLLAVPEHDQFRPPASAVRATEGWRSTTIEVVRSADHFLAGRTSVVRDLHVAFVERLARP
jgi:uncharacterized protein